MPEAGIAQAAPDAVLSPGDIAARLSRLVPSLSPEPVP
jgi:hypothetical protein